VKTSHFHTILQIPFYCFPETKEWIAKVLAFYDEWSWSCNIESWISGKIDLYSTHMANKLQELKYLIITFNCNKLQRTDLAHSIHYSIKV